MTVAVKMCGLRTAGDVDVAASAGARYVGFVFFAASPRNIDIKAARDLAVQVPDGIAKVALVTQLRDEPTGGSSEPDDQDAENGAQ